MNLPQVYMCSPSWTLLPPPSPFHPSGSSQCTSPNHPVSCIEPGLLKFTLVFSLILWSGGFSEVLCSYFQSASHSVCAFNHCAHCLCSLWCLIMAHVYLLLAMKVQSLISLRAACEINMKWSFMKLLQLSSIFLTVLQGSWHLLFQVGCIFDNWL